MTTKAWKLVCSGKQILDASRDALTVGVQEGWRKEAVVHEGGEGNDSDHVVRLEGQTHKGLGAHFLLNEASDAC